MDLNSLLTLPHEDESGRYVLAVYSDLFSLTGDSGMAMKQTLLNVPAILSAKRNGLPVLDVARKLRDFGVQS